MFFLILKGCSISDTLGIELKKYFKDFNPDIFNFH